MTASLRVTNALHALSESLVALVSAVQARIGTGPTYVLLFLVTLVVALFALTVARDLARGIATAVGGDTAEHRVAREAAQQLARSRTRQT